ncbi:MAG: hypothetical protein WB952_23520 [Terriglobales bacterium]
MTKRTTKLVTALSLAVIVFAGINCFAATSVLVNAAGSTGAFNAFALAADNASSECGNHIWTKKNGASGIDNRSAAIPANTANVWIVWNTAQTHVCSYLAVDSVIGQQLFFAVPRATLSIPSAEIGSAGDGLVATLTDEPLPTTVYNALNNQTFNAAPTDIRAEDALFEANRVLAPLDTKNYNGLGWGPGPIGTTILTSQGSGKSVTPVAYAILGTDPISGAAIPKFVSTNVGAQCMMFFVNTTDTNAGGFGTSAFQNVPRFVLADMLNGTLTRTRDMANQSGLPSIGAHVFLREPTSGTYTTTEFTIPRTVEIASTQELNVNPAINNPTNIAYASGGTRQRVIGSGEMVSTVGAVPDSLGYAFWSTTSFAKVLSTTKYLTVDGVDPLFSTYLLSNGVFPNCVAPCPGLITFPNIANGSYPAWNILRVITASPVPKAVATLITQSQSQVANVTPDFLPLASLQVFRSHYTQSGKGGTNGLITGHSESGGDVGGAVFTIQSDLDYYADTGHEILSKKQ